MRQYENRRCNAKLDEARREERGREGGNVRTYSMHVKIVIALRNDDDQGLGLFNIKFIVVVMGALCP